MRWVCLCALSSSAVTFSLLSPKSRVELQHIIATRATRPLFGRIADMRYRRLPSNHRGDRIACCETPRITGSRLQRPRRAASWAPVGLRRYLRRARLRAPRGGGRLCAAFRYAGAENAWSGSATAHNRKQHIEPVKVKFTPKFGVHDVNEGGLSASAATDMFTTSSASMTSAQMPSAVPYRCPTCAPVSLSARARPRRQSRHCRWPCAGVVGPRVPACSTAPFPPSLRR